MPVYMSSVTIRFKHTQAKIEALEAQLASLKAQTATAEADLKAKIDAKATVAAENADKVVDRHNNLIEVVKNSFVIEGADADGLKFAS